MGTPRTPGNRKEFVRTQVPGVERAASIVCLALLVAIGGWVWWKGRHYDPGLYVVRSDSLNSTRNEVTGKDGTAQGAATIGSSGAAPAAPVATISSQTSVESVEGGAAGSGKQAEGGPATAAQAAKGEPLEVSVAGTQPMGPTEFYNADNLYEKIDGRAPAYLGFNFQALRCRTFSVVGAAGSYVDVYEYRFDTPINAFGMFALERDAKGAPVDFAPDGYAGEMGFFYRQGAVYVQIIASDQNARTMALAKSIAEERAKNLPADNAGLDGRRRLPVTGLDPASVQFVQDNALGQDFLTNVFQATYDFGGKKLPFFVMAAQPDEAAAAWAAFKDFCGKYGGTVTPLPDTDGAKLFSAQGFGTFKVIYLRPGEVGGVFDAPDADAARAFVQKYLDGEIK
jgi:hypothetical protein